MIVNYELYENGNLIQSTAYDNGITMEELVTAYRYEREVGGVPYLGKTIQTDRETRANWIGILINAQSNPAYTVTWKTIDGFVTYNAQEAIGAALAVSNHVQKCFDAESAVLAFNPGTEAEIIQKFEAAYNA